MSTASPVIYALNLAIEREKNGASFSLLAPEFTVAAGQILAIVGQSGCGKSTLLDVLALILRPTRADHFFLCPDQKNSIDLALASDAQLASLRAKQIGYVLQSGGLFSFLSVRDNILLPGRLLGMAESELLANLDFLATRLDIRGHLAKKPQHLSGGQRQRAAIARALVHRPGMVLADEPTAAVDQETAVEIFTIFQTIVRELQTAVILVSHDLELVQRFADTTRTFSLHKEGNAVSSVLLAPAAAIIA